VTFACLDPCPIRPIRQACPLNGPESATDLDSPVGQESSADVQVVNPFGNPDAIELRELVAFGRHVGQPHRGQAGLEGAMGS